jgi:uncharacterized membrane-anchored protein
MNRAVHHDVLSKVPEVTLVFWITKVAATTLGEIGGDSVTMTLDWGYLVGTLLFLGLLIALVICADRVRKIPPVPVLVDHRRFHHLRHHNGRLRRPLARHRVHGRLLAAVRLSDVALALWYRSEGKLSRLRQEIAALKEKPMPPPLTTRDIEWMVTQRC